jgi:hypothetical protein
MEDLFLTDEQEEFIWSAFNEGTSDLKKLTKLFVEKYYPDIPDNMKDGRSVYGRAVRGLLAEKGERARGKHEYQPVEEKLDEKDEKYIDEHYRLQKIVPMGRALRGNHISGLHKITSLIREYMENKGYVELEDEIEEEGVSNGDYEPPKTFHSTLTKIVNYSPRSLDKNKITQKDKKNIDSLRGYLNTYRFIHQINSYNSQVQRDLFESSFIRYTNDKPDLSQEEVDQYIVLSGEVVIASNIQIRVDHLQRLLDTAVEENDGKVSMSLVESISSAQTEYNQCVTRQQKLLGDLKEKRSDRLKNQIKENASILNLVQMWKEEETRSQMLKLAELRKKVVKEEIEKLSSMDEMKARIMGLSEEEVFNG